MKRAEDIKRFFKKAAINTNPQMDKTVLNEVLMAHKKAMNSKSGAAQPSIVRIVLKTPLVRFAAAVLLFTIGYVLGQFLAPQPVDVEQLQTSLEASLRASLEPAIRQDILKQFDQRWQASVEAQNTELKNQFYKQVRRDLAGFASQTLGACESLTNQRLTELVELIEAARMRDRRQVATALELIELSRLEDKTLFRNSLQSLAALANELQPTEQN